MPTSKLRKKAVEKKKNQRRANQGKKTHKYMMKQRRAIMKDFQSYVKKHKDNIVQPQDLGLGEEITYDDIKDLKIKDEEE